MDRVSTVEGRRRSARRPTRYDNDGRLHTLTDPDSNTTTFTYNAIGEQTEVTSPSVNSGSGVSATTAYDADGEVTDTTDADGRQITYSYDSARPTRPARPGSTARTSRSTSPRSRMTPTAK